MFKKNLQSRRSLGPSALMMAVVLVTAWSPSDASAQLNVVTTTPTLASIVRDIGKEHVNVNSIAKGTQDLHKIQAKPSYMMQARKADLWIRVGLMLETGYEKPIIQGSRNTKILEGRPGHLDASRGVLRVQVPEASLRTSAGLNMGDVHPLGNPHYWLDPYNIRIVARTIGAKLSQLDPDNKDDYIANFNAFVKRVDEKMFGAALVEAVGAEELWTKEIAGELDDFLEENESAEMGGWRAKMAPLKGQKVITYHRSWNYFMGRFGIEVPIEVEPKPGIPPSAPHIKKVIDTIKTESIGIILMEPFYSPKAPNTIAEQTGVSVVVAALSVEGQQGIDDYIGLIDNCVNRLTAVLNRERN